MRTEIEQAFRNKEQIDLSKPHIYVRGKAINEKVAMAAPELLEALKAVKETLDLGMTGRQAAIYDDVIKAIKKATL